MSDTAIFIVGCIVMGLLLSGVILSVGEVRRLYENESARRNPGSHPGVDSPR